MLIRVYKGKDAILVRYDEELRVAPMLSLSELDRGFISMVTDLRYSYSYDPISEKQLAGLEILLEEDILTEKSENMHDKIVLTRLEIKTIIEDAFIDGWKQGQESDWYDAEDFLHYHVNPDGSEEETQSETTIALKNLMEGE